ncbi:hypothetical protein AMECASPLE_021518 [Ameca splendens]|uniref:Uncharacterized protein n=1 Tax=Ameca splendens TaxID=208324 RepID=A0ABV0YRS7_9TELE
MVLHMAPVLELANPQKVMEQELDPAAMELDQVELVQVAWSLVVVMGPAVLVKLDLDLVLLAQDWEVLVLDQVLLDQVVLGLVQAALDLVEQGLFLVFLLLEVKDWEQENHQNQAMDHRWVELDMDKVQE